MEKDYFNKAGIIVALSIVVGSIVHAWTGPTAVAPANNVAAPINVGTGNQVKNASLGLTGDFSVGGTGLTKNICLNGDCRSVWPTSGVGDLTMNGYAPGYVNAGEDSYAASTVYSGQTDTCDGDIIATYSCKPSEFRTCVDVIGGGGGVSYYDPSSSWTTTPYTGEYRTTTCLTSQAYVKLPNVETKSVTYTPDQATYTVSTSKAYGTFWVSDFGSLPGSDAGYPSYTQFAADGAWHTVWNWTCDGGNYILVKYSGTVLSVNSRGDEDCDHIWRHSSHILKATFK